ncbi:Dabb family protein [uncultured Algoriphagus sp.]|uniref:Dabb family protein n=1 Tax=uncultured Algoriphagus sp. TaxID=417365 RepID=UPI0030EDB1DF|tara:strand:- start:20035 stop:20331 length:297 start_codon:yes stop_codon:yes gene_type:complete
MLTHSVFFKLKFPKGSSEELEFLRAAAKLEKIPGVQNFRPLRQLSSKNDFDYGLTMDFDGQEEYDSYNQHPEHREFVNANWGKCVANFMEIDYEEMVR